MEKTIDDTRASKMQPANDPNKNYKALVETGYDRCADAYHKARRDDPHPELALLTDRLADGAAILDIGCGAGVPIARSLARQFAVTGVDISAEMIARARANVPGGTFIHGDIMAADFSPKQFAAVTAFYSIFHLPREEHEPLLRRIADWLKPGGYLLATLSAKSEAPYTEDDFFGTTMYWSHHGLDWYRQMLIAAGFELLTTKEIGHGYGEEYHGLSEKHPLVFARLST